MAVADCSQSEFMLQKEVTAANQNSRYSSSWLQPIRINITIVADCSQSELRPWPQYIYIYVYVNASPGPDWWMSGHVTRTCFQTEWVYIDNQLIYRPQFSTLYSALYKLKLYFFPSVKTVTWGSGFGR